MKKMQNKTIIYIIVAIVISLTIGFASLSNTLLLEDILAIFRIDNELRVTNFFVTNVNNGGSSLETEYNHDRVVASIYLPNSDSTVTYKVVVTNLGNKIAQIKDITNLPSNIDYELNDYNLGTKICDNNDKCRNGVVKEFFITFKYADNAYDSLVTTFDIESIFVFDYIVNVTYEANILYMAPTMNITSTSGSDEYSLDVEYNPHTSYISFDGSGINKTTDFMYLDNLTFNEGDIYKFKRQVVSGTKNAGQLIPAYHLFVLDSNHNSISNQSNISISSQGESSLVVSSSGAQSGSSLYLAYQIRSETTYNNFVEKITISKVDIKEIDYGEAYILPSDPVRNGFTFGGWYTEETGGVEITSEDVIDTYDDITLYAHWIDNDVITEPIISYEKNYNTTSLALLYDGRNNTGTGSSLTTNKWYDLSGNASNVTLTNASWDFGYVTYNGSSTQGIVKALNPANFTVEAIVSFPDTSTAERNIVDNYQNGGYGLTIVNGKPKVQFYSGGEWRILYAPEALELDTMYSISGTYDRTSLKLYINGELVGTMAYTGAITSPEDSTKLAIGCNPKASACTGGYFNGNIYAVRVYTRALSADEVKQNYFVDSLYMERFNNINPVINLNGGSSNLGILKYQYKTSSSNTWNDYDPDNLPSINENDITTLSVRTLNINHTDSNTFDDVLYFDKDIPIGSLDYSIDNLDNFVVDVDVEAIDALSGVKNYGYSVISSNDTCDDTVTFSEVDTNTYSPSILVDGEANVCVKVEDVVGNKLYLSDSIDGIFFTTPSSNYQQFVAEESGYYLINTVGASGGGSNGGKGASAKGYIYLNQNETLYVYVGGKGGSSTSVQSNPGGVNGGGTGGNSSGAKSFGGGGATDIRFFGNTTPTAEQLVWNSLDGLKARIMVAGGGGGGANNVSDSANNGIGGPSLGLLGKEGSGAYSNSNTTASATVAPANQIEGGTTNYGSGRNGTFGYAPQSATSAWGGGGGAGYYAGATGYTKGGSGGSSFISGFAGSIAINNDNNLTPTYNTLHYSNKYFINSSMQSTYNSGNGKAYIKHTSEPERTNVQLNGVRYIKDCVNGNTANVYNHWNEIQAIKNGVNLAYGKTVTGTSPEETGYEYSYIVDSYVWSKDSYGRSVDTGLQCVTVDLEQQYDLDEIGIWHLFGTVSDRTYYNNVTYVSSDNDNWTVVINRDEIETRNGKRVNAWDMPLYVYTIDFASDNLNCTLGSSYIQTVVNYGDSVNFANPSCYGYQFDGWTLSGDADLTKAKYGTTANSFSNWEDSNKGTYFKNLSSTNEGSVTLTAHFSILPTKTVTIHASPNETITWSGNSLKLNSSGEGSVTLPTTSIKFTCGISSKTKTVTVTSSTTHIYLPRAIYWNGTRVYAYSKSGWTFKTSPSGYTCSMEAPSFNTSNFTLTETTYDSSTGLRKGKVYATSEKVSLTGYSTLNIYGKASNKIFSGSTTVSYSHFGVDLDKKVYGSQPDQSNTTRKKIASTASDQSLSISSLTSGYIFVAIYNRGEKSISETITINRIWLE